MRKPEELKNSKIAASYIGERNNNNYYLTYDWICWKCQKDTTNVRGYYRETYSKVNLTPRIMNLLGIEEIELSIEGGYGE